VDYLVLGTIYLSEDRLGHSIGCFGVESAGGAYVVKESWKPKIEGKDAEGTLLAYMQGIVELNWYSEHTSFRGGLGCV